MKKRNTCLPIVLLFSLAACQGSTQNEPATAQAPAAESESPPEPLPLPEVEPDPELVESAANVAARNVDCGEVPVYFETEKAELRAEGKAALDEIAECLLGTKTKEQLTVTGRADPRGTEQFNLALSERRAEVVVDYLTSKGVSSDGFEVHARGERGMKEGMPRLWPKQRRAVVATE